MTQFEWILIELGGCAAYVGILLLIGKILQKSNSDKAMAKTIGNRDKEAEGQINQTK